MNLKLNYEGFERYLKYKDSLYGGIHYIFRFENGYGASVIKHGGSYGRELDLWELAVIKYTGEGDRDWNLTYETEITDDVIGHLTDDEVKDLLKRIKEL